MARLKLNGATFALRPPRPAFLKVKAFLDKSSPDELFTADEVARRCGVGIFTVRSSGRDLLAAIGGEYSAVIGRVRYWGNPKAIAELLRQVAA